MTKTRILSIAACVCSGLGLLTWFLPDLYHYLYMGASGKTEVAATSLFAFFPASVLLPLICTGITLWAACKGTATRGMYWSPFVVSLLQIIYLWFVGCVYSLPFLLNLLGMNAFLTANSKRMHSC